MNKKKVIKIVLIILLSIMIPSLCCGGYLLYGCYYEPNIWEWEMDEEMEMWIEDNFELTLPEEYEFVKGRNSFGLTDLYIVMDKESFLKMTNNEAWEFRHGMYDINFMGEKIDDVSDYYYVNNMDCNMGDVYYKETDSKIYCYVKLAKWDEIP